MDVKTQLKIDVISKVFQGKISIQNASKLLGKSPRTVERYLAAHRKKGILFAQHGNSRSSPLNKTSSDMKKTIQALIKEKYYDFNLTHLREKLVLHENITIGRETLRKLAHEIHHVKRAKKRRKIIRKRRDRMSSPGLLLQLDGSQHLWFGDKKACLMAIIDDANSEVWAEFFPSETTSACMKLLQQVIAEKGVFKALYVDRAGIYGGPKRCHFSQVQRACEELGIEILYAHSAEAKGRIERSFDTFQDRLIPELRLQGIKDIEDANSYLKNTFIPIYWNKNIMVIPESPDSEYSPLRKSINLKEIFIQKEYRKIRNDHTFSFCNTFYEIESPLKTSIVKQKIEIRIYPDGRFKAFFANRELKIKEVILPNKSALYEPEIQNKIDAIELAKKLNNVSEAARISGVSRGTIYKNKKILETKGALALKRTFNSNRRHRNRTSEDIEKRIVKFSLENPHLGQAEVSKHVKKRFKIEISAGGIRNIWLRYEIQTMKLRLEKRKKMAIFKAA